jgi:hypothetical protein
MAWFIKTCLECQIRNTAHLFIPPIPSIPALLFRKAYFNTTLFPVAQGFHYLIQARCSLTNYLEWTKLKKETGVAVGRFIFESLLCRWGGVETIVMDNGAPIVTGLKWLSKTYHINHIQISPYNKQANGVVERSHRMIRESIVKACKGDTTRWPTVAPFAFWVDRITVRKATGYSLFHMVHGVEPVLPFDLAEATFLPRMVLERTVSHTIPSFLVQRPLLPFPSSHSCVRTVRFASVHASALCRAGPLDACLFLVLMHQLLR